MLPISIILPDKFFLEEVRDDYTVSRKMKKIWAVELDLLQQLMNICESNNIKYYASGGTLLGACRHAGFIPWDDDIDIAMPRKEFIRFCDIAAKTLRDPYFLQTEKTDPGFNKTFARVINTKTTAIPEYNLHSDLKTKQGIWIDVFPMDVLPDELNERNRYIKELSVLHRKVWAYGMYSNRYKKTVQKETLIKKLRFITGPVLKFLSEKARVGNPYCYKWEKIAQKYCDYNYQEIGNLWFYGKQENTVFNSAYYKELTVKPFEIFNLPVPANYDAVLTKRYGNWHEYVKGTAFHFGTLYDPEKPYVFYLKNPDQLLAE